MSDFSYWTGNLDGCLLLASCANQLGQSWNSEAQRLSCASAEQFAQLAFHVCKVLSAQLRV